MNQVECCFINRLNGSEEVFARLEKRMDVQVETFSCIGNCTICPSHFHAIINGVRLQRETPEALYDEMIKAIIKNK